MVRLVCDALTHVSYPGWRVEIVGGGRRSNAAHDADILVTHYDKPIDGVVLLLRDHLIAIGKLFPPDVAMCRVQSGLLTNRQHIQKIKEEHKKDPSAAPGYQTLDRFDHIYGKFQKKAIN